MNKTTQAVPRCTADEALQRLKAGNERFVSGRTHDDSRRPQVLASLAKGQHPFATILGCSDSRVPPELLFDADFGDLFIIRVAGNVLGPSIAATLQYASAYLHTALFVILGHEGCGAVQAALAAKFEGATHCERLSVLLDDILPALDELDPRSSPDDLLNAATLANVRHTMRAIVDSPEGAASLAEGRIKIVGAICDLDSGHVQFLDDEPAASS